MLDIQRLRTDLDQVVASLARRGYIFDANAFIELEAARKTQQTRLQQLQAQRNTLAKQIGIAKKQQQDTSAILTNVAQLAQELNATEESFAQIQHTLDQWLMKVPNLPHDSVPAGHDERDNVEIRRIESPRQFDFAVKDHVDIGAPLGLDQETGARLAGTRFTVLRGDIALLHRALAQFMLNTHITEHGYTEMYTPYIVNDTALYGTGHLPKFADDMFKVHRGGDNSNLNQYLISTAEITLTNIVGDTLINSDDLPLKFTAHSPCFRSEAGSYGRDTRGMIRQHQFDKVEMVQIVPPAEAFNALEEMVTHAETILQKLALPYRVVSLCSGDMGFSAMKTYDLEVWLPAQNTYREISSCSNCGDFQARRLKARFKDKHNRKEYVHTLNGSGLAVGRTLVAVLENYQNADGSVTVPTVLRPYMHGKEQLRVK